MKYDASALERLEAGTMKEPNSGCWLWTKGCTTAGYGLMWSAGDRVYTHRLTWAVHRGPIPEGLSVLHHCDTPPCVNPEHLFLGTQADNLADASRKGRLWGNGVTGEAHARHRRKLNRHQVAAIRDDLQKGLPSREVAQMFGVARQTINDIKWGRTWRWLPEKGQT